MTQTVLITGAAGGIGQALCQAFKDAEYRVVGLDQPGTVWPVEIMADQTIDFDLSLLASEEDAFSELQREIGQIDCLVNNAAVQRLGKTASLSLADWQLTMAVNLTAPFRLVQACMPELKTVVNISSVHAYATKAGFAAYATSKAGLSGMTRALAVDLGPDVRVVAIAPAAISTDMLEAGFEGKPEARQALDDVHPLKRVGAPSEVAKAAVFLASDQASFMTGATVSIDGGILSKLHDPD